MSAAEGPNAAHPRCATERVEAVTSLDILYNRFHEIIYAIMEASDGVKSCGSKYNCPDGEPNCETRCACVRACVCGSGVRACVRCVGLACVRVSGVRACQVGVCMCQVGGCMRVRVPGVRAWVGADGFVKPPIQGHECSHCVRPSTTNVDND